MPDSTPIPMLERRRIEAAILKHVYDTLKASHGVEVAHKTIADAVRRSSIEQAKEFAAKVGGKTSMQTFIDRQALWKAGGGMEMEVKEQTATGYVFQRYALPVRRNVSRDGPRRNRSSPFMSTRATFCEGYDKRLRLTRTQTIMQGAGHCDFHYQLRDDAQQS